MKRKILIKIVLILIISMLLCTGNVKAVYQSTPYTHANPGSQTWDDWLKNMRTMETTGGAMGLTETLDGTKATSDSNNIDVHMMKATEYGAIAILSASGYGNLNNTQKPETSTADTAEENKTGVYYNYDNWEFTACIHQDDVGSSFSRYWDKYNTLSLRGMSPSETWHGGNAGNGYDGTATYDRYSDYWTSYHYTAYWISPSAPRKAGVRSIISVGKNGLFSYNWGTRYTSYTRGGYVSSMDAYAHTTLSGFYGNPAQGGTVTASSFYARGAVVNMTGI